MADEDAVALSLGDMPAEAAARVLSLAGPVAAACAAMTCRSWRAAAAYPPLWRDFMHALWHPLGCPPRLDDPPRVGWAGLYGRWAGATPAATLLRDHAPITRLGAAPTRRVNALAFGVGALLHSAGDDGALVTWHVANGCNEAARCADAHAGAPLNALAACGNLLATGGGDNAARLWDVRTPLTAPVLALPNAHSGEVFSVAWLGGGDEAGSPPLLATGGGDEVVRVWDARAAGEDALLELEGGSGTVYALAHDAEASRLYAAVGREVCLFDLADGAWLATLGGGHGGDVYALALGATALLSGGDDGRVCEWARPAPHATVADEEPQPRAQLAMTAHRGGGAPDGGAGARASVTSLVGLGADPSAFLAGTWEGYIVLAEPARGRIRPFGRALLREDTAAVPEVPVTALAARDTLIAAGADSGALRLLRMDDMLPEEDEQDA